MNITNGVTPLPWRYMPKDEAQIVSMEAMDLTLTQPMPVMYTGDIGGFVNDTDGEYSVMAANWLPECVTALEGIINVRDKTALDDDPAYYWVDEAIEAARELLAKLRKEFAE